MLATRNQMILYGINNMNEKLDSIIKTLNLEKQYFEVKLIISEAINNAFVHGNNSDISKPISVKWELKEKLLKISVTDCGPGIKDFKVNKEIDEENLLEEWGRGLYIINSYTDKVKFEENSIIMEKYLL